MKQKAKNKKPNVFVRIWDAVKGWFSNFGKRFVDGSLGTKLSHFIFGAGNFYHKQFIKGALFLLIQVAVILLMVLCPEVNGTPFGYKAIGNLSLGGIKATTDTEGSDDTLRLLFGLLTIAALAIYVIVWLANIASSYKADMDRKKGLKPTNFRQDLDDLGDGRFHKLMLTPTLIAAGLFTLLPTIFMICIAFTTYNDIDMSENNTGGLFYWNGFNNFVYMFTGQSKLGYEISARFFPVLGWTIIWAIFATFTCYFGGIFLALLINKKGLMGKKIFRTFFVITMAVPQFISLLAVRNLFNSSGPINSMLMNLGWIQEPIKFFGGSAGDPGNEWVAKIMVIIINMWLGIPYTMLMTSGILMNIPTDLYEAARVDGASKGKMFWKITLPYVVFVTTPYLISSFIGNINSFNTIFLLTGGAPEVTGYSAGGTDLLVTWLYKLTKDSNDYNLAATIGIIIFVISATFTLISFSRSGAMKNEEGFQ